jgi:hypothetical protein
MPCWLKVERFLAAIPLTQQSGSPGSCRGIRFPQHRVSNGHRAKEMSTSTLGFSVAVMLAASTGGCSPPINPDLRRHHVPDTEPQGHGPSMQVVIR